MKNITNKEFDKNTNIYSLIKIPWDFPINIVETVRINKDKEGQCDEH